MKLPKRITSFTKGKTIDFFLTKLKKTKQYDCFMVWIFWVLSSWTMFSCVSELDQNTTACSSTDPKVDKMLS